MRIKTHELPTGQLLYYFGPDLGWGAVPTIFYFSISGKDSLGLDPFNQPCVLWSKLSLRVCSIDLPNHAPGDDPVVAIHAWAKAYQEGKTPIEDFLQKTTASLNYLKEEGYLDERLAFAGLSRGAFFASHLAAIFPLASYILGFAPLTRLFGTKEFIEKEGLREKAEKLDLIHLKETLYSKTVRFYIGNHDTRVGTRSCFDFLETLSKKAEEERIRSAPIEMIMGASIGHQGHGTSLETFTDGAVWLAKKLGIRDEAIQA